MKEKKYITTPIYYINDKPHIGHTYSTVAADILARYYRALGKEVFFLVGTDENAQKSVEAAKERDMEVQAYVDEMSKVWKNTWKELGISYDKFIRTTEENHKKGVYKFLKKVKERGDIYKGKYEGLYCEGCEDFITEKELEEGLCPLHKKEPKIISEENYFFKLSNYKQELLEYFEENTKFIQPTSRKNEVVNFVENHAKDFSISRQTVDWGIPFPEDKEHTVYVWFDALINYLTGIGYGRDEEKFSKYWPADLHIVGKDIIKFHCAYWPAMLLSAGLKLPEQIFAHGFFTINGEKISKSLGNSVDPLELRKEYPFDAVRYYLFSEIPLGNDGDFSTERLKTTYNAKLANGLGNLLARVAKLCETSNSTFKEERYNLKDVNNKEYNQAVENLQFQKALEIIWGQISILDKQISEEKTWELEGTDLNEALKPKVEGIRIIGALLEPFLPETAQKINDHFSGEKIKALKPLFPRK